MYGSLIFNSLTTMSMVWHIYRDLTTYHSAANIVTVVAVALSIVALIYHFSHSRDENPVPYTVEVPPELSEAYNWGAANVKSGDSPREVRETWYSDC